MAASLYQYFESHLCTYYPVVKQAYILMLWVLFPVFVFKWNLVNLSTILADIHECCGVQHWDFIWTNTGAEYLLRFHRHCALGQAITKATCPADKSCLCSVRVRHKGNGRNESNAQSYILISILALGKRSSASFLIFNFMITLRSGSLGRMPRYQFLSRKEVIRGIV